MAPLQLDLPAGFQVQGRALSGTNGNSLPTQLQFSNAGPVQQAVAEVGGPLVSAFLSGNGVQELQGNVGFSGIVFGGGAQGTGQEQAQIQTFQDVVLDLPASLFVTSLQQAFPRNATAPTPPAGGGRNATPPPATPPPAESGRRRGFLGRIAERVIGGGRGGGAGAGAGAGAGGGLGGIVSNLGALTNMIKPGSLDVSLDGLTAVRASATLLMPLGFPVGIQLGTLAVDAMLQERPVIDVQVPGINNGNAANELPLNDIRVGLDRGERGRFFGAVGSGLRLARGLVSGELVQNLGIGGLAIGDGAGQIQTFKQVQLAVSGLVGGGGGAAAAAQPVGTEGGGEVAEGLGVKSARGFEASPLMAAPLNGSSL
ncbi:hypothetical protein BCR44DRAFT_1429953 [Catenaria anguillulae PL171]|uniref:Uncharacterized protein n=1 Tax=Catenaria anguillulae PL171 TaxID=765915 RepID=A0A1Y2HV06_9FUNG|nr:hypothetical protein BCR44DRAFT_1429953 [Catenaria anguillulae PL171]